MVAVGSEGFKTAYLLVGGGGGGYVPIHLVACSEGSQYWYLQDGGLG